MRKTKKSRILSLVLCMSMIISTFAFVPGLAYAENTGAATDQTTTETEPSTEKTDGAAGSTTENTDAAGNDQAGNAVEVEGNDEGQPSSDDENTETEASPAKTVDFTNVAPFLSPVDGKDSVARKARAAMAKAADSMIAAASGNGDGETSRVDNDGVVTTKTATPNGDGSYKIRLESYVTGATTTTTVTKDVPTDIVLVLDQSGSMAEKFGSDSYDEVYELDQSKTYYVKGRRDYDEVTWCTTCQAWTSGCWSISWPTEYHNKGTQYTPKTSVNSSGTQFFEYYEAITKLKALQNAANSFVDEVAKKAKGSDGKTVDHRIAVVGYASSASNLTKGFQDMSTDSGKNTVTSVIDKLSANGGTMINQGIDTANSIFETNPIPTNEKRNRVMIVFTDGAPGMYGDWASGSVTTANNAIKAAKTSKETYKATVYSVGIFEGADASQPSSLPEYTAPKNGSVNNENQIKNSNRFMHLISSNYPNASDINTPGTINANLNGKSYYLSASNSAALNDIFQQISSQIESGGASVKLDSSTVVKDIVSDYFQLPEGTQASDITLKTADFDGYESDNKTAKWKNESPATGVTAAIEDRTVKVTGFDFAENYVGIDKNNGTETARGKKLIIEFNVKARDGFLGGNAVPTNGKDSGIYTTKDGEETVVENFEQPTVDIPIKEISVTAPDKNVYLLGSVLQNELKAGISANTTDDKVTFDLSKTNYGLEAWQTAYVDLTVSATDKDNKDIFASGYTGMSDMTDDMSYTVNAEIKAKGAASGNTASATGKINVFRPELTYKDSNVYYGDTAPTSYAGNKDGKTVWKHGNKASTDDDVTMPDSKPPVLDISYSPAIGSDEPYYINGKISTKQDIPVKATVKIGAADVTEHVTFKHLDCSPSCGFDKTKEQFLIHVKTCSLTITKKGGEPDEPYVMNIYKDGELYTSMTIVGNASETVKELPAGTYTVQEDTDWAWRYDNEPNISGDVTLNSATNTGTITVENHDRYQSFLNGYSTVVKNIFGGSKSN